MATIAYKVRQTGCPAYLASSVVEYMPTRPLRSSSSLLLQSLQTRTVIACLAFSQAAPKVWNDLPLDIRDSVTFDVLDPPYALIITSSLLTMAVVHLDRVTLRS